MSTRRKLIYAALGFLVAVIAIAGIGLLVVAPGMADTMVNERLERIADRSGLTISTESVKTVGLGGVEIRELTISDDHPDAIVRIGKIEASVDLAALVTGSKRLENLSVSDIDVTVHIAKDGTIGPIEHLKAYRAKRSEGSGGGGSSASSLLERLPDVNVANANVRVVVEEGGPQVPLSKLSVPEATIDISSDGVETRASVFLEMAANAPEGVTLPKSVATHFRFDENLEPQAGEATFDGTLALSGMPPLPWLRVTLGGFGIDDERRLYADALTVGVQGSEERQILAVKRIAAAPNTLDFRQLSSLRITDVLVDEPVVQLVRDERGAFALSDAVELVRPSAAPPIVASAKRFAERLSEKKGSEPEEEKEDVAPAAESAGEDIIAKLKSRLPDRIEVRNARIRGSYPTEPAVLNPAKTFSLEKGALKVEHHEADGTLAIEGGFEALADDASRGSASARVEISYTKRSVKGEAKLDALDLSWLGLVVGPRFIDKIPGGIARASLEFVPAGEMAFDTKGLLSLEGLSLNSASLAEEPLKDVTASYAFDARFDAKMAMPNPTLLKVPIYEAPDEDSQTNQAEPPPAPVGGLVFRAGSFQVNQLKGTFRPALYGFNAPEKRPARIDLLFEVPRTPVMTALEAVPPALLGACAEAKMTGDIEYKLNAEVPLYRAGDMEWDIDFDLHEFELLSLPAEVDVRRLLGPMDITITDSIEEEDDFERTIRIDGAHLYSIDWLLTNTHLELEEIDERRREREVELPTFETGLSPRVIDSPEVWSTPWALNQIPPKPWRDGDPIVGTEKEPYGPYVFVPIEHISGYMVRGVMTTEDNSFYTHEGFNTHALKASIERNIEAGGFRRGASTIAMQMIKNVFLHRKKVMSRKLQEAFLVFLMESVVDIPKTRIMEIYLNVIEFGPGIFGIHDAAVHYFGKRPDALTLSEVAWLVSIIPSPKKYHFYYEKRGEITDRYFSRMKRYLRAMNTRERITQEELDAALLAKPEFYIPEEDEPLLRPVEPKPFNPLDLFDLGRAPADGSPVAPGAPTNPMGVVPTAQPGENGANPAPAPGLTPTP